MEKIDDKKIMDSFSNINVFLNQMLVVSNALSFHIQTIQEEDDLELIQISLEAILEIEQNYFGDLGLNIKELIRNGIGDYKIIQAKCIKLGLV